MQDNPTLEVLAVVTAVDKISEPAALSAVLFLSIPDFVCFQRRPTPIGDSLGSYASGPKICHAGLGFNHPVFSHQILRQGFKDKSCPGQEITETRTRFQPWFVPTSIFFLFFICLFHGNEPMINQLLLGEDDLSSHTQDFLLKSRNSYQTAKL